MAEYIEREAVHRTMVGLKRYSWTSPVGTERRVTVDADEVNFGVDKIPAADVVEVVRCEKCKYFLCKACNHPRHDHHERSVWQKEIDFCSYGERRDDHEAD